ncbi:CAP domain-containing protein [Oribacterium sp. FC2011]|uniref:CAP domain-containing protein n=1 Tax=Oribacterium sp. FC2011 TaxID=1408311 RepID=UPI000678DC68|nr:CAP domain-containing protein [Oribacterium sp. FC2011]
MCFFKFLRKFAGIFTALLAVGSISTITSLADWEQTENGWMYFESTTGMMATGWKQIDGKWYCLNDSGILYTNCTTPDGYYVDANGVWVDNAGYSSYNAASNSVTACSTSGQKTLNELYQENFDNGTFINYGASTTFIDYGSSGNSSNDSDESAKSLDELSNSEIYKLITGSYNSASDPTKGLSDDEAIDAVVYLVNVLRDKKGLDQVVIDDTVQEAAEIRAEEASEKFSHTRPDGSDCFTALDELGWPMDTHAAENLAQGQKTALQVVNAWWHSSGHKHNMMHEKNNYIGVGISGSGYSKTWAQMFSS